MDKASLTQPDRLAVRQSLRRLHIIRALIVKRLHDGVGCADN
jgi:hypothetical protein